MEISEILHEVERNRGYFPEAAVREAIVRREEITLHLLRILEETIANAERLAEDGDYFAHIYAMLLLAQFRETAAYPLMIKYTRLPGEQPLDLGSDSITDYLPRAIAAVCDGNTEPIKSIVEDTSINDYVRGAALRSLQLLAGSGKMPLAEFYDYLGVLVRTGLERKPSQVWNELVCEALDAHAVELLDDIRRAYKDGLVDESHVSSREVEDELGELIDLPPPRDLGLIDDTIAVMGWWDCFKSK